MSVAVMIDSDCVCVFVNVYTCVGGGVSDHLYGAFIQQEFSF